MGSGNSTNSATSKRDHNTINVLGVKTDPTLKENDTGKKMADGSSKEDHKNVSADLESLLPESQLKFDNAIRFSCLLVKPESFLNLAGPGVQKLELKQSLPHTINLFDCLTKLSNLQTLDVSGNNLGPPGFRTIILSLCNNPGLTTLNIAGNQTDTDSAECIGKMLTMNKSLTSLNVSGNYLGLDFFSRCVGPALATNTTLQVLTCESIGSTDLTVLSQSVRNNETLTSLSINSNHLSDAKTVIQNLSAWLKESSCCLKSLSVKGIGMSGDCLMQLCDGIKNNATLTNLYVSANQCSSATQAMDLILACAKHSNMTELLADDIRSDNTDPWNPDKSTSIGGGSELQTLSFANCSLLDQYIKTLLDRLGQGSLSKLLDLNLTNNAGLSNESLNCFRKLSCPTISESSPSPKSSITRLSFGSNNAQNLSDVFTSNQDLCPEYLNLRRAKINPENLMKLSPLFGKQGTVTTLVLDAIKLAGTGVFASLFEKGGKLAALSLASCQLNDSDLSPLCAAIKSGHRLQMLKLSDNRLTDEFVVSLCDALQSNKTHPLAVIDISSNSLKSKAAKRFSDLLTSKHKSLITSLNVSFNGIDAAGLLGLVACVTKTSLQSLNASNQSCSYYEDDCDNIYKQIVKTLGMKVVEEDGMVKPGCCDIPKLPNYISYKLNALGGSPGEYGKSLHSRTVVTDSDTTKTSTLTLAHALQIASYLKGQESAETVMSAEDWSEIIGKKDSPTWLQVAANREKALFLTGLPASITIQKMEGILELEADCNVDEVCLMKDIVTRKNNGLAWVLLSDLESVLRALDLFNRGEALVFSQPFTISSISVKIDDEASSEAKARQDIARRTQEKKREEAAHRALIDKSYVESQARHAYRLAHPAYADGRIW